MAKMFRFLFISGKKSHLNLNQGFLTQFLKAFENNADVSNFIFQDAVTQEELILLIQNVW
jgi:F0F1-type ATP synthase delta subunit